MGQMMSARLEPCIIDGCFSRAKSLRGLCTKHDPMLTAYAKKYHRNRYDTDIAYKTERRSYATEYGKALKYELFVAYGGAKCACCGESELAFLQLDHINNDGATHRNLLGGHGAGALIYQDLKRRGYPPGYQVLCANCNSGKWLNNNVCPHKSFNA
jgi:hypothetical protein